MRVGGRGIATVGVLIAAIAFVGCGGEAKESSGAAATVTVTEPVEEAPSAQTETAPAVVEEGITDLRVGQSGKDGTLTFRVVGARVVKSIPLEFSQPLTAPSGAKLLSVRITYRNDGRTRADPFCGGGGVVLIDDQDRNFEPDTSNAILIAGNKICEGVQPGFRSTEQLPFVVPAGAKITDIAVWDNGEEDDYDGSRSFLRFAR